MTALSDQYNQQLGELLGTVQQVESMLVDQNRKMTAQSARIADLEKTQTVGADDARAEHTALVEGNQQIAGVVQGLRDTLQNLTQAAAGPTEIVPPAPGTGTTIPSVPTGGAGMTGAQPDNPATTVPAGGTTVIVDDGAGNSDAAAAAGSATGPNAPTVVPPEQAPATVSTPDTTGSGTTGSDGVSSPGTSGTSTTGPSSTGSSTIGTSAAGSDTGSSTDTTTTTGAGDDASGTAVAADGDGSTPGTRARRTGA